MTEIPEHLLKRSRERRSNLDLGKKVDTMAEPIKTEQEVRKGYFNFKIKVRKPVHRRTWRWEVWAQHQKLQHQMPHLPGQFFDTCIDRGDAWTRDRAIKKATRAVNQEKRKQENKDTPWEEISV